MENQKKKSTLTKQKKQNLTREFCFRQMEGEGNERRFELSFSSEEPYDRWFGPEILDHAEGALDLSRLKEMGCVLWNHHRDDVIGKIISVEVKDLRGIAVIEIDDDEESEVIFNKMKSGTLKGVSVGYAVNSWEEVAPGKKSADGKYTGPCQIARSWMPYEISIVSVPADATVGVGRDMEQEAPQTNLESKHSLEIFERQLLINKNVAMVTEK